MNKLIAKAFSTALTLTFVLSSINLGAQTMEPEIVGDDYVKYPVQTAKLYRVVDLSKEGDDWYTSMKNSKIAPEPKVSVTKEEYIAQKLEANLRRDARKPQQSANKASTVQQPTLGTQFWGNTTSGTPNDNDIAVNDGGKVISVVNTSVWMFRASSNAAVVQKSLSQFVGGAADTFDPTVLYDTDHNRFIVSFLSGSHTSTSRVYVAFSATSDPFGTWNVYWLTGDIGGRWPDFTHIGVSTKELFITANMANNGSTNVSSGGLWQVNKFNGYAGDSALTYTSYAFNETGFHPVQGGENLYGPDFYLVQTASVPFNPTKAVRIRQITNSMENNGTLSSATTLNSNLAYDLPPDAEQDGGQDLSTNGSAVTTAYFENEKIQFACNSDDGTGQPGIYYGTVTISPIGLSFSSVTGQIVSYDSIQLGYPGLGYAGTDGMGGNRSVMMFNFAGPNHYPGNACVYIDESGDVSDPLMLRYGLGAMQEGGNEPGLNRWGDYANAAERTNNIGEVWIGGSLGKGGSNTNGCYISQVYAPGVQPIAIEDELTTSSTPAVYPNPVVEMLKFDYPIAKTGQYHAAVYDINGKVIADFGKKLLKRGEAYVTFSSSPLQSGTYFLRVSMDDVVVHSEKFVVAK